MRFRIVILRGLLLLARSTKMGKFEGLESWDG